VNAPALQGPAVLDRPRILLGKLPNLGDREYVYRCDDALEVDQVDGYEVETKRVFFSDVELVTWHQRYSAAGLWIGGVSTVVGLVLWLLMAMSDETAGWVGFWFFFLPNVPVLLWFLWPYWYVTVFGRRTSARMRWHFRRQRSREVFEQLARDIGAYQAAHRPATIQAPLAGPAVPVTAVSDIDPATLPLSD
jgi:hypothetical protein